LGDSGIRPGLIVARQAPAADVKVQILAAHIVGFHQREYQSAPAIEKAQPEDVAAEKPPLGVEQDLGQAAPLPIGVEGLPHELRVALHALLVVREAPIGVMLEVTLEPANASLDARVLVNLAPDP